MSVGEKIREVRKQQGLSMAELGKRLGITAAAISRYELGQRQIRIDTLRRIAAALNADWLDLIPEDERGNWIAADVIERIGKGGSWQKVPLTPKDRVEAAFERLSPEGQQAAAERLEELALLDKYAKKEPSDGSQGGN